MSIIATDGYCMEDLIIYRGLDKGGVIGRGFEVTVPDLENADPEYLEMLETDMRIVLASMKDSERLQIQYYVGSDFQKPLKRFADETRQRAKAGSWTERQRSERFVRYAARMKEGTLLQGNLRFYFSSRLDLSNVPKGKGQRQAFEYLLETYRKELDQKEHLLDAVFGGVSGSVRGLDDKEHHLEFLRYLSPTAAELAPEDITFDGRNSYLENTLHGEPAPQEAPDYGFYQDGRFHGILVAKTMPKSTVMGMVSVLTNLPMPEYRVVLNITPLDVEREIQLSEKEYEALQSSMTANPKLRMVVAMQNKMDRTSRLMANKTSPFLLQMIVIATNKTKTGLRAKMAALKSAMGKMHGVQYYEPAWEAAALSYWNAALPGWAWDRYRDYSHKIDDVNLVNLIPLSSTPKADLDEAEWLHDGDRGNLIGGRLFDGPPGGESPAHAMVFGSSGAGKSVLMQDILTQSEPYYGYTAIIDYGLSYKYYTMMLSQESRPVVIRSNGNTTFNYLDTRGLPMSSSHLVNGAALTQLLAGRADTEDRNRYRQALLTSGLQLIYQDYYAKWARKNPEPLRTVARQAIAIERWLKSRMTLDDSFLDAFIDRRDWAAENAAEAEEEIAKIDAAAVENFIRTPETAALVRDLAFAFFQREDYPTHSEFQDELAALGRGSSNDAKEYGLLAKLLEPWMAGGLYGPIVDGYNNINLTGQCAHFELGSIKQSETDLLNVAGFLITNDVMNHIMTLPRGVRKRAIIEELSAFLEIPNGDKVVRNFYERMRKYNCACVSVIQQYRRFRQSAVKSSVLGNCKQVFFLRQADKEDLDDICETFPLPEVTKRTIMRFPDMSKARPGKDHYSGYVLYQLGAAKPKITTVRNYISKETAYVTSSTGSVFTQREKDLRGAAPGSLVDTVIQLANQDSPQNSLQELEAHAH